MGGTWRGPAMRVLYDYCQGCQEPTAWDVRPDLRPFLDRRVGVRCRQCGKEDTYTFRPTPKAEREYQADQRRRAAEAAAKRGDLARGWLAFHVEHLPPVAMPDGDTGPPTPRWEFLRWLARRGAWAGPYDRAAPEAEVVPPAVPDEPPATTASGPTIWTPPAGPLPGVYSRADYEDGWKLALDDDGDPGDEDGGGRGR